MRGNSVTPEEIEQIRALAAQKLSAFQIGEKIRKSRNAIIGLCRRNGIQLKGGKGGGIKKYGKTRTVPPPKPPEQPVAQKKSFSFAPLPRLDPVAMPVRFTAPAPLVIGDGIPLFSVRDRQCRFPIGDPRAEGFGVCGRPTDGERVYCQNHCQRAFVG